MKPFINVVIESLVKFFNASPKFWDQDLIDSAVDSRLKAKSNEFIKMSKPLFDYLEDADSIESAIEKISNMLKKFDTETFESGMVNLLFTSELVGRFSNMRETGRDIEVQSSTRIYNKKASLSVLIEFLELAFDKSPEDAVKFLESQGITISWDWKQQADLIRKHSFTVAKVSSADILQLFKDKLVTALKDGSTIREFTNKIEDILIDNGYQTRADGSAFRIDTIYRTNLQSAYMAGRFFDMLETVDDFPYWQYLAVLDSRTRASHAALNEVTFKANDSFWTTHYPPSGYNCRCRVKSLSEDDIRKKKIKVSRKSDKVEFVNPDGEIIKKKISQINPDEGFDSNPAQQWTPDLSKYSPDIRQALKGFLQ